MRPFNGKRFKQYLYRHLTKLRIQPGEVIVWQSEPPLTSMEIQHLAAGIRHFGFDNLIINVPGNGSISTMDEHGMEQAGWVRSERVTKPDAVEWR